MFTKTSLKIQRCVYPKEHSALRRTFVQYTRLGYGEAGVPLKL